MPEKPSDSRWFYHRTLTGRVVYDRPKNFFSWKAAARMVGAIYTAPAPPALDLWKVFVYAKVMLQQHVQALSKQDMQDELARIAALYGEVVDFSEWRDLWVRTHQGEFLDPPGEASILEVAEEGSDGR